MNFKPRLRPASDFEIKPRRSWLARFRDFWTHETIDAMQARMLREVWEEYRLRRTFPISYGSIRRALVGGEYRGGEVRYVLHNGPIFVGSHGGAGTINGEKV